MAERYCRDDWADREREDVLYDRQLENSRRQCEQDELIRKHEEELQEQARLHEEEQERRRLEDIHDQILAAEARAEERELKLDEERRRADERNARMREEEEEERESKRQYEKLKSEMEESERAYERLRRAQIDKAYD
jgi:hypothetical protein